MEDAIDRPFYSEFAWAYDVLMTHTDDVRQRCAFIAEQLSRRGVEAYGMLRDAGCGTGAYSLELARLGYRVEGIDLSAALILEARRKALGTSLPISFTVGNLLDSGTLRGEPPVSCDAILCRGVLNDLTGDEDRKRTFLNFASSLREGGSVILDVREWEASVHRKDKEPVFERSVETSRGETLVQKRDRPRSQKPLPSDPRTSPAGCRWEDHDC